MDIRKGKSQKIKFEKKYLKIITSLSEINKLLTLTLNRKKTFNLIVNSVAKIIDTDVVTLRILSKDKKELILQSSYGSKRRYSHEKVIKSDQGIAGLALKYNRPVVCADITKDKRYGQYKFMKKERIRSLISVPLILKRKKVGVLSVYNKTPGYYTYKDAKLLQIFAQQCAVALEIAQLFEEVNRNCLNTFKALATLIDMKDKYTHGHSQKVQEYSLEIAKKLGLSKKQQEIIRYASFLHDLGKIGIGSRILKKKKPLTFKEWEAIRRHPENGANAIKKLGFFDDLVPIILHHHERFNGSGYPGKQKGNQIPLGAKILAVADAYDAMTSDRPYRSAYSHERAVEELKKYSGKQFDPLIVKNFIKVLDSQKNRGRGVLNSINNK